MDVTDVLLLKNLRHSVGCFTVGIKTCQGSLVHSIVGDTANYIFGRSVFHFVFI